MFLLLKRNIHGFCTVLLLEYGLGGLRPPKPPQHNDVYTNAQCFFSERFAIAFSGIWEIKITIVAKNWTLNYDWGGECRPFF